MTLAIALVLSGPVLLAVFTPAGRNLIRLLYNVEDSELATVCLYLRLLTPLLVVDALRNYYTGLLVQAHMTRTVTVSHSAALAATVAMLLAGRRLGWTAPATIVSAMLTAGVLHLLFVAVAERRAGREVEQMPEHPVHVRDVLHFFWPVATTSVMFATCRPVIYAFVNRMDGGIAMVAAMRVAFDFAMLFHHPVNQFRHFFVTFGNEDMARVRRFMILVMLGLSCAMGIVVFTPIARSVLGGPMNIKGEVLEKALTTLKVLCLTPLAITFRNFFHGRLLLERRTLGMAVGAFLRVVAIVAVSWYLYSVKLINHVAGAAMLIGGFVVEAIVSSVFVRFNLPTVTADPASLMEDDSV